jgi:hypothetical protein
MLRFLLYTALALNFSALTVTRNRSLWRMVAWTTAKLDAHLVIQTIGPTQQ